MKQIKDIEKAFDLLKEARSIFSKLGEDTIVSVGKMHRCCIEIDKLIKEAE